MNLKLDQIKNWPDLAQMCKCLGNSPFEMHFCELMPGAERLMILFRKLLSNCDGSFSRRIRSLYLIVPIFSIFMLHSAKAQSNDLSGSSVDIIGFFKGVINSPPDIESIVGRRQNLAQPTMSEAQIASLKAMKAHLTYPSQPIFFEGARSGENFYFSFIRNSNELREAMESGPTRIDFNSGTVDGREGSNSYQVGLKELRTSTESQWKAHVNKAASISQSDYGFLSQLIHMGIGSLKENTAVWSNNLFTADRDRLSSIHGELLVSNGLPFVLNVGESDGAKYFEMLRYTYPDPPYSLGGYPKVITLYEAVDGEWQPVRQYDILAVRLAQHPLAASYFSPAQFITNNSITHTNVFAKGTSITLASGIQRTNPPYEFYFNKQPAVSREGQLITIFCFLAVTAVFAWLIFRRALTNSKTTNNKKRKET